MFSNMRIAFKFMPVRQIHQLMLMLSFLSYSVGCSNALSSFANKTTDPALYYSVLEAVREAQYSTAISYCGDFSDTYLERTDVITLCASAYAGRCGFSTLDMATFLSNYPATTPKLFPYLLTLIPNATATSSDDCNSAVALLRTIGVASDRTADENAFMVLLALHTVTKVLKESGDANNDDVIDVAYSTCSNITAGQAQKAGLAFYELDKSLDELSTNSLYGAIDVIVDALCTALTGLAEDLCAAASPGALSAAERKGIMSVLHEGAVVGIDQNVDGATIATSNCP